MVRRLVAPVVGVLLVAAGMGRAVGDRIGLERVVTMLRASRRR